MCQRVKSVRCLNQYVILKLQLIGISEKNPLGNQLHKSRSSYKDILVMVPSIETLAEGFMGLEQAFQKDSRPHFCAHSLIRSPNEFHFSTYFLGFICLFQK